MKTETSKLRACYRLDGSDSKRGIDYTLHGDEISIANGVVLSAWFAAESVYYPDPPPEVAEVFVVQDSTGKKFDLGLKFDGESWRLEACHEDWPLSPALWDRLGEVLRKGTSQICLN